MLEAGPDTSHLEGWGPGGNTRLFGEGLELPLVVEVALLEVPGPWRKN